MRWLFVLGLVFAPTVACGGGDPVTEVVIVVDSDLAPPDGSPETLDEVDEIDVVITAPGGETQQATAELGPGRVRLPRALGVVHEGGRLGPFDVRVVARLRGSAVLTREARFSFVDGQSKRLYLQLLRSCRGMSCDPGTSCGEGGCGTLDVPLDDWTGSVAAPLMSIGADAGVATP